MYNSYWNPFFQPLIYLQTYQNNYFQTHNGTFTYTIRNKTNNIINEI
jgi:hypothetical protein